MNRTDHQRRVDAFMHLAGQERPTIPIIPSEDIRRLRAKLILEEALETIAALGFAVKYTGVDWTSGAEQDCLVGIDDVELQRGPEPNLIEIADGCADISVVTIGTLSACGINDRPLLEEVDRSNLAKFGPGSYRREDGKWMKSSDWVPPDIKSVLAEQAWRGAAGEYSRRMMEKLDKEITDGNG